MNEKVLVGLITGLLCIMPAAGVMAEEAAAETKEAAAETTNETQALSDDIYSFQAEIDGEIYQFPMSLRSLRQKAGLTMEMLRRRWSRSSIQQQKLLRRIPQSCMLPYLILV